MMRKAERFLGMAEAVNAILDDPNCPVMLYNDIQDTLSEGESAVLMERDPLIVARALAHMRQADIGSDQSPETMPLAELISDVLRHPDLPEPLFEGIRGVLTVFFNEHVDQNVIQDFEGSAAYLDMLLSGYRVKSKRANC